MSTEGVCIVFVCVCGPTRTRMRGARILTRNAHEMRVHQWHRPPVAMCGFCVKRDRENETYVVFYRDLLLEINIPHKPRGCRMTKDG